MSGTWKGTDKPGGARFVAPRSYRHDRDCPRCRYGTLQTVGRWQGNRWESFDRCIDCGHEVREKPN